MCIQTTYDVKIMRWKAKRKQNTLNVEAKEIATLEKQFEKYVIIYSEGHQEPQI